MDHWNSRLKILGKNGFVLQRYFYHKRKWPFRWYLFRVPFSPRYLVSADSTVTFPLGNTIPGRNTRVYCLEYLNFYLKQILSLLEERKCSYKNNRKKLQNSVCQLGTQGCWHKLVQKLISKLPVLKRSVLLKSWIIGTWKTHVFSHTEITYYRKSNNGNFPLG